MDEVRVARDGSSRGPGDRDATIELELLRRGHWFGSLPAALQALIVQRSYPRVYAKGAHIVCEGASCNALRAVLHGRVHVVRGVGEPTESLFHVGEAGFWFGEYGMLSGEPAIASVVAATAVRVLALPAAEFECIVADEPRHFRSFAKLLVDRYATVFHYATDARSVEAEEWVRLRLEGLAGMRRLDAPDSGPVEITASQAELATMVGVTRQRLSVLLGRLQARGLIDVGYRKILVLR